MTGIKYYLLALLLAGTLVWELISGRAPTRMSWRLTRQGSPVAYWFLLAVQFVILLVFLFTGKSWHVR
jgi:hypothetical protein